ncbi:ABC transporter substrate-binding protein [Bogoriella caseilytica]|uniref:Iron complex transport system substrate-binding protein n=1 Tax=Bogoriella caseilytica TaxID=56055 RepID=A0A3N2BDU9_9MICO|nr:ABC transporter substrate-binding protein [Bogoriella caseilytica]ROR73428.1 iron complex transport system substrate-binding protein [Bogoriella caseilytica]
MPARFPLSTRLSRPGAIAIALVLTLGACAATTSANPEAEPVEPETADSPAEESSDETVHFEYGEFSAEIPADPQRVVVIEGRADLEFALTVDYPVIASGFFFGREGALFDELDELISPDLHTFHFADSNEPDYEVIASLEPDLIVMRQNAYLGDFYGRDRLSEIAPILGVETGVADWQDVLLDQATELGREEAAAEQIQQYTDLVEEITARSGDELAGMSMAWGTALNEPGMLVITNSLGYAVAEDLGIDVPHFDPTDEDGYYEVSEENLDAVADVDALAIFAFDERPALGESETFARLPAVQDGRVRSVDLTVNQGLARAARALALELEALATS